MKKKIIGVFLVCALAIGVNVNAATSQWSLNLLSTASRPPSGTTSKYIVTANKTISGSTTSQTITLGGGNNNAHYTLAVKDGMLLERPVATWTNKSSGSGNAKRNETTFIKVTGYTAGSKLDAKGSISY